MEPYFLFLEVYLRIFLFISTYLKFLQISENIVEKSMICSRKPGSFFTSLALFFHFVSHMCLRSAPWNSDKRKFLNKGKVEKIGPAVYIYILTILPSGGYDHRNTAAINYRYINVEILENHIACTALWLNYI